LQPLGVVIQANIVKNIVFDLLREVKLKGLLLLLLCEKVETDVFHQCKETHMNTGCSIYILCKSFPYDGVPHECIYIEIGKGCARTCCKFCSIRILLPQSLYISACNIIHVMPRLLSFVLEST
jgi:hypothetical protein